MNTQPNPRSAHENPAMMIGKRGLMLAARLVKQGLNPEPNNPNLDYPDMDCFKVIG